MVQTSAEPLTLEEFLQLPETEPASEYINGEIIQKPMPQAKHSAIQGDLVPAINAVVRPQKIARAFPELRSVFAGRAIVPDVSVFLWDRIPRDEKGRVTNASLTAPDWLIEILSPDQSQIKLTTKILHALRHGTQMGWLIAPEEQIVLVYSPNLLPEAFENSDDLLPVPPFAQDLQITVGTLFDWLSD